ncbi:hypothetical protein BLOT_015777 [Blomia tropicalis]|nr:hypothetical protein BLOT_015777 [Blomia tropicalis]
MKNSNFAINNKLIAYEVMYQAEIFRFLHESIGTVRSVSILPRSRNASSSIGLIRLVPSLSSTFLFVLTFGMTSVSLQSET